MLLHGGLVDARFFAPNLAALAEHFHVYTPERRGHGHTPDVESPITYQLMTDDTTAFLRRWSGSRRTWSATATAPLSRCWWRCSGRSW